MKKVFTVRQEDASKRSDVFLAERLPDTSRSWIQALMKNGKVLVNGVRAKPGQRVSPGDLLVVEGELDHRLTASPEDIPLTVVYNDRDLAVIDKPAGLVVHPAPGHATGTVANALAGLFPEAASVGAPLRPGIVHRLDKDTSGLMALALNAAAFTSLREQIAARSASRAYLALVAGSVEPPQGTIEAPIGRDSRDWKRMAVHGEASRAATTSYRTKERIPGFTFLEARLHSGRTHQIRVHFAALGHPLAGDKTYGGPPVAGLERQFLHSHELAIDSPSTGRRLEFWSPLPEDLRDALDALRRA